MLVSCATEYHFTVTAADEDGTLLTVSSDIHLQVHDVTGHSVCSLKERKIGYHFIVLSSLHRLTKKTSFTKEW